MFLVHGLLHVYSSIERGGGIVELCTDALTLVYFVLKQVVHMLFKCKGGGARSLRRQKIVAEYQFMDTLCLLT